MANEKSELRKNRGPRRSPAMMASIDGIAVPPSLLEQVNPAAGVKGSAECRLVYGIFAIPVSRAGRAGTLTLNRKVEDGGVVLGVSIDCGQAGGFTRRLHANIRCKADRLSTPTAWDFTEEMRGADGPVPFTKIAKTGVAEGGTITIKDGTGARKIASSGAYTINWALFDAVGRLPRERFEPVRFDMIEDFDQFKPGNRLHYRSTQQVRFGDGRTTLHIFDHFGFGSLPCAYFVNDAGVMVMSVSGLRAYGLLAVKAGAK